MQSMTGYAFIEKSTDQFSFSVEIKCLNSRYLEIYVNSPRLLKNEEPAMSSLLKEKFQRGKIELNIDIYNWETEKPVNLNQNLIKKYYNELKKIHKSLDIREPFKFESVLSLDGIIHREKSGLTPKSRKEIYQCIEIAAKKTIEMRIEEGLSVKNDLLKVLNSLIDSHAGIKLLAKNLASEKKNNLKKKIDALSGNKVDDMRMLTEIAILADKIDINEEIVRLNDHFKKFKSFCNEKEQVGKKLDFIAQEIFREINTIASKSNSSEISHIVVDMKNQVEKIREQCRNIV